MIVPPVAASTARSAPSIGSPARTVPPILWPCGAILLGNALGPERHHAWAMLALLAGALLLLALVTRMSAVWLAAVTMGVLAATLWHLTATPPSMIVWPNEATNAVRGMVETWPQEQGERVRGTIVVFAARTEHGWQPAHATLRATLPAYPIVQRGDVVVIGGAALIRQSWWRDADGSLYGQWARVEQRSDAETAADVRHNTVGRLTAAIKRHVRFPESGLTVGMIFGETSTIDERTRDALNATGTTQHVVISGWNIAIVIGFINVLGGRARNRRRALWAIGSIAGVLLFTYAVGAGASVVRAAIMGCGGLIAPLVGRRADPLVWLGIASAAMAVQHPAVVGDLSFLLSCAATFGVLIVAPAIARYAERFTLPSAFPRCTELVAVAVGAQLMTEPLIAHAYGRISLISPLVNLVVEPLVPCIMALGFVTALLSFLPFSLPAAALGICTTLPAWLFLWTIGAASTIPGAGLYLPHIGTRETVALYAIPVIAAVAVRTVAAVLREIECEHRRPDRIRYVACFAATLTVAIVVVERFR